MTDLEGIEDALAELDRILREREKLWFCYYPEFACFEDDPKWDRKHGDCGLHWVSPVEE